MPTIDWNRRAWNDKHSWELDGDEWSGMAAQCGAPYEEWKSALVASFIAPYAGPDRDVLEIAPGFGRWTAELVDQSRQLTLVDLNPRCISACQERFAGRPDMSFVLTDGRSLPGVPDASVDFVWSFDSFVHMDLDVVDAYLSEIMRVLRPGGTAVLHHANKRPVSLHLVPLTRRTGKVGKAVQQLASQGVLRGGGNRGNLSQQDVARCARNHGLEVELQTSSWGPSSEYNVDRFHDCLTVLRAP